MKLKRVELTNFRNYYGENAVEFGDGVTLLLGQNGDGKTCFYEALSWLFDATARDRREDVSRMLIAELKEGDVARVAVALSFEHKGENKELEKAYEVEITEKGGLELKNFRFAGYESVAGERRMVDARMLVMQCFDDFARKFCMFQGERDLARLNNEHDFNHLIQRLAVVKGFDDVVTTTEEMAKTAANAVRHNKSRHNKEEKEWTEAQAALDKAREKCDKAETKYRELEDRLNEVRAKITETERYSGAVDEIVKLNASLEKVEKKILEERNAVRTVNKAHALLDEKWVLCAFAPIFQEFSDKCAEWRKEKKRREKEMKRELEEHRHGTLVNGAAKLPWHKPHGDLLQEMLDECVCKVCNREAPVGSEPYKFMEEKLKEFREGELHAQEEDDETADYMGDLLQLKGKLGGENARKFNRLPEMIAHQCRNEVERDTRLQQLQGEKQKLEEEKSMVATTHNLTDNAAFDRHHNGKNLYSAQGRLEAEMHTCEEHWMDCQEEQETAKKKLEALTRPKGEVGFFTEVKELLEQIHDAAVWASKENRAQVMRDLERRAQKHNHALQADGFSGQVRLVLNRQQQWSVALYDGEQLMANPSTSQRSLMYLSVLLAISDCNAEKGDTSYPMIFDAPTSELDAVRVAEFYRSIIALGRQCIVVTKDFLSDQGQVEADKLKALPCDVYRIKKAEGFDSTRQETIRTNISKVQNYAHSL